MYKDNIFVKNVIIMEKYFYVINGEKCGPLFKEELISAGVVHDTLVWCEGMSSWIAASQVPALS